MKSTRTTRWLWAGILFLAGCSSNGYSDEIADDYMKGCTASGNSSPAFCRCMLGEIEQEYSEKEFKAMDQEMNVTQRMPEQLLRTVLLSMKKCGK